ncbi:MAG: YHS domain-containing protein [Burkholderiales bacterium]|nr:YHS domain-containing protein [Burkholderiales bacterium]
MSARLMNILLDRLHHVRRRALLAAGLLATAWLPARAAPAINTLKASLLGGRDDVAILGHDPVAYFTVGKPVKGSDEHVFEWMGAKWKFASRANLETFRAEPAKYAPQYGGYCAFGVSRGYLVKIEPDQFTIFDGKLYLNYDASVQAEWRKDPAGYIKAADAKFPALLAK